MSDPLTALVLVLALAAGLGAAITVAQHLQSGHMEFFRHYLSQLLFFNLLILSGLVYRFMQPTAALPAAGVPLALTVMAALKLAWLYTFGMSARMLEGRAASGRRVRAAGFSGLAVLLAYTALSWTAWFRHWPTLLNVSVIVLEVLVIGGALLVSAWVLARGRRAPRGPQRRATLAYGGFHLLLLLSMLGVLTASWSAGDEGMKAAGWMSGLLLLVYNLFPTAWIRRYPGASAPAAEDRFVAYGVTPRERQVIELIQAGRTNQEIADQLFLSLATVKDYNNRLFRKCGVRNRVELANLFR
jgi:DNA-binding CsgD family transcriptional regulator